MEKLDKIRTKDLIITNSYLLNKAYIQDLCQQLKKNPDMTHPYGHIYVRLIDGKYYVNDGNHFVTACLMVGIERVLAMIYEMK